MNTVLKFLKNRIVQRVALAFVAALGSQSAVQALLGGRQPLTTTLAVSALLGAAVAVLEKYLPPKG